MNFLKMSFNYLFGLQLIIITLSQANNFINYKLSCDIDSSSMKSNITTARSVNSQKLVPLDLSLKPLSKNYNSQNQQNSFTLTNPYHHTKSYDTMFNEYQKQEMTQRDKQLKERLDRLNGNLKIMQKKYKQNLKQGFDNKIKAYRLQAVMERKLLKQTIDLQKKRIQQQQLLQKHKRTIQQKQYEILITQKVKNHQKQKVKKVKQDYLKEKQKLQLTLNIKNQSLIENNRSIRQRILSQEKQKDRKKNYLQFWRMQQVKRQQFQMKKDFLQKIVNNSKKLNNLKDQLHRLKQKQIDIETVDSNRAFITL